MSSKLSVQGSGSQDPLYDALTREHRAIDEGLQATLGSIEQGAPDYEPLRRALEVLRRHLYIEEAMLFPPLQTGGMAAAILVMLREHGRFWNLMNELDAETTAKQAAEVGKNAKFLLELLERHNTKEEPVLYEQLAEQLPAAVREEIMAFLPEGVTPDGWSCERAGAESR
ncbi:MAG: hemerythrin domain-containing protein [Sorangiineae bacterium]|nr:hemerythrin domain-containing protein [Polyangiaceae bacterium]MEB2321293.1 hemerythrin domain-containing protein [Sorangiineae bacterium]